MEQTLPTYQALITRLPYSRTGKYNAKPLINIIKNVDLRSLICISMPIHVEHPNNGGRLTTELEDEGLFVVAKVSWHRDRHVVCIRSKRLTNTWEPLVIFSKSKNYVINREAATKIKKGYENKDRDFNEDDFQTCIGDHWGCRNDRRDRRFLPSGIVLNCGQLSDLHAGDSVLDPFGNPGVKDTCDLLGWKYVDGGLPSPVRPAIKKEKKNEEESLSGNSGNKTENIPSDQ